MVRLEGQINQYVSGDKEKQLNSIKNECKKEEKELRRLQKKLNYDEHSKTSELTQRLKEVDEETRDVTKEIKLLKRL